jgi:hypothetical protein
VIVQDPEREDESYSSGQSQGNGDSVPDRAPERRQLAWSRRRQGCGGSNWRWDRHRADIGTGSAALEAYTRTRRACSAA